MAINAHLLTVLRHREHTTYVIHTSITYKLYWLYLVIKSSVNIREVAPHYIILLKEGSFIQVVRIV